MTGSLLFSTFSKNSLSSCTLNDPFFNAEVARAFRLLFNAVAVICFILLFLITENMVGVCWITLKIYRVGC